MPSYAQNAKEQLGMALSTARSVLLKQIVFELAKKCGKNRCCRCKKIIKTVDDFAIHHIDPWLHKENATELFFDVKNIGFSHGRCNSAAARCRHTVKNKTGFKGVSFCRDKKRKKPYRASIRTQEGTSVVGYYETAKEAAKAYDKRIVEVFGNRAVTNEMLGLI